MEERKCYDLIGIGIGPFNLGLAALSKSIPGFNCLFIDENDSFNWHPGMMLQGTSLQVPFYADLVTLADPCNPFSYLSYLKAEGKMFRFAILERYFIQRSEFNNYCRWVASQLSNLKFGSKCHEICFNEEQKCYEVKTRYDRYLAKRIVIGIGTIPYIPKFAKKVNHECMIHSSSYLFHRAKLLEQSCLTIIGSGQSAAEIFYDLLQSYQGELSWFTRSSRFFPMDYSKFALEMASPDYVDHFYSLDATTRKETLAKQIYLYKGINASLISEIYERLAERNSKLIHIHPNCSLENIQEDLTLEFFHCDLKQNFIYKTNGVIMATGYKNCVPDFLLPISEKILWNNDKMYKAKRNYSVNEDDTIFVQNAELHTHGFNAPDLGMGPYRNAVILNTILGYEHFQVESKVMFQNFGLPQTVKEQND